MNKPREDLITETVKSVLRDFVYEDIIPYEYLERALGSERTDMSFGLMMGFLKENLVEYSYVLKPIINEGYKVLHPREFSDYVLKKNVISTLNKLDKGLRILRYADISKLNTTEKEKLEDLEIALLNLYRTNESEILNMQFKLNEARAKELTE